MTDRKTLLVTGGSRGIGAATALLAAKLGWRVAVNYTSNEAAAAKVVAAITDSGGEAFAVKGDVGSEADILEMFKAVDERYGRLEGLVNNAGIAATEQRLDQMDSARIERIFRVNVTGSFLCAREAIKRMSTNAGGKGGSIVNLSSAAATLGGGGSYVDYAATKGAIDVFTLGLGREVASEGIRVNAVRPGMIDTDIHADIGDADRAKKLAPSLPMKRAGTAEEVAEAIVWLLSDASSYTTGSILSVTGGR
ncbi:MAG: SDR family oxidoreductase [Rhizobiaceae bacterium]|nr:SDR family oxidoreductase [Rhizobiaceae bacterium]